MDEYCKRILKMQLKMKSLILFALLSITLSCNAQLQAKKNPLKTVNNTIEISFNQDGTAVWIYKEVYFKGEKKILKAGSYTLSQLGTDWNDVISSLKIPNGYVIEMYIDDNFKGTSIAIYGTKTNKNANTRTWVGEEQELDHFWNDKISSIKIIKL